MRLIFCQSFSVSRMKRSDASGVQCIRMLLWRNTKTKTQTKIHDYRRGQNTRCRIRVCTHPIINMEAKRDGMKQMTYIHTYMESRVLGYWHSRGSIIVFAKTRYRLMTLRSSSIIVSWLIVFDIFVFSEVRSRCSPSKLDRNLKFSIIFTMSIIPFPKKNDRVTLSRLCFFSTIVRKIMLCSLKILQLDLLVLLRRVIWFRLMLPMIFSSWLKFDDT